MRNWLERRGQEQRTAGRGRASSYLGIGFNNSLASATLVQWGILGAAPRVPGGATGSFAIAGFGPTREVQSGVDRTFSFDYDPVGPGGNGRIIASVSGAGEPVVLDLDAEDRQHFNNARFDAFGINYTLFLTGSQFSADYRFDDLTYTVVPEPSAAAFLWIMAVGVLRRRRTLDATVSSARPKSSDRSTTA